MRRLTTTAHDVEVLAGGWEMARTEPGRCPDADPGALAGLSWTPAMVPGTAAPARSAGPADIGDACDWWFRARFAAAPAGPGEEVVLALDGLATVAEVYLNGERILTSDSMFTAHEVDVGGRLRGDNELLICCRALTPLLAGRRRPRARWRTRLVANGNLRFVRTMLLGRAVGIPTGPPLVGPWRPVRLERRRAAIIERLALRPRIEGRDGILAIRAQVRAPGGERAPSAAHAALGDAHGVRGRAELSVRSLPGGALDIRGEVRVAGVERWWPQTHGSPVLYGLALAAGETVFDGPRVGFRDLDTGADPEQDGLALRVNGEPVFARGAVWTPRELAPPGGEEVPAILRRLLDAGMNMVRIPGTACYESPTFHDLCDELGILVWQDFMFANLDYPEQDDAFVTAVRDEARAVLAGLAGRPSLAVLCGGSEVAQQVAMLGLDPDLAGGRLYTEELPALIAEAGIDAGYLRSSPIGGELPFRTDRGIAHYYGVGAYLRPLEDVRRAGVRFAAESLAVANVPDDDALDAGAGRPALASPAWKAGVPRDAGSDWDFDDVRDHYLAELFGVEPLALRRSEPERYLALSRALSGELMAEVFGEWRRAGSGCGGGLVLWLADLAPGAGWGVLDHRGRPKAAYGHLRRALAPRAVWTTDEGLGGIAVHVANDGPEPLIAGLRVALYRELSTPVHEATTTVRLEPHGATTDTVERILGRFVDASCAYRFGPPGHDVVVASLEAEGGTIAQAFRFPAGRRVVADPEPAEWFAAEAVCELRPDGSARVTVSAQRLLYGVRLSVPGWQPSDDGFCVEPGHPRVVELVSAPGREAGESAAATLTAVNLRGRLMIEVEAR